MSKRIFFIGIGGSGMSGLAQITCAQGNFVFGSDRNFDQQRDKEIFTFLQSRGIKLFPQDGTGIGAEIDEVIISGAIEDDNLDLKRAREFALPVVTRAELLARLFNSAWGIAVAGTSGKSTITAMAAKIMDEACLDPTVINGAIISEYKSPGRLGNVKLGNSHFMLIETDESDGSLVKFYPEIGILANISKDHKPLPELIKIFSRFIENIKNEVIVNGECPFSRELSARIPPERVLTFGFTRESGVRAEEVTLTASGSTFKVQETLFSLPVPGKHNVANALAAIALGIKLKIPLGTIRQALKMFQGVERRLSLVGETSGIKVFDDFSHNAAKIAAALETLKLMGSRLIVIYQPHGFGPTKLIKEELIATFNLALRKTDIVILLDIFYVGGTAEKTISSAELVREICVPQAENLKDREQVIDQVAASAQPGDVVVVMGARDNSLTSVAQKILRSLKNKTVFPHKKKNDF